MKYSISVGSVATTTTFDRTGLYPTRRIVIGYCPGRRLSTRKAPDGLVVVLRGPSSTSAPLRGTPAVSRTTPVTDWTGCCADTPAGAARSIQRAGRRRTGKVGCMGSAGQGGDSANLGGGIWRYQGVARG